MKNPARKAAQVLEKHIWEGFRAIFPDVITYPYEFREDLDPRSELIALFQHFPEKQGDLARDSGARAPESRRMAALNDVELKGIRYAVEKAYQISTAFAQDLLDSGGISVKNSTIEKRLTLSYQTPQPWADFPGTNDDAPSVLAVAIFVDAFNKFLGKPSFEVEVLGYGDLTNNIARRWDYPRHCFYQVKEL